MNSKLAHRIGLHLNKPDVTSTLNEYVHERIKILQRHMIELNDPVELYRRQGAIRELEKLLTLREDALRVMDLVRQNERLPD